MPRLQINLDETTAEALASLAGARGTTSADFVAELVMQRVHVPVLQAPPDALDAIVGSIDADPVDDIDEVIYGRKLAPPDALDALVGRYCGDRVNDIDEVVYGR